MEPKKLHIICLDIPYPADYGGAIDMYYKIKSLHSLGLEIILHCFQYGGRTASSNLENLCYKVYYYPRKTGLKGLNSQLPYIVSSRHNKELLENLCLDEYPILFEGIHTTFYASHEKLKQRQKILRLHNIESEYYTQLATHCSSYLKKLYYYFESSRLNLYEKSLTSITDFIAISQTEFDYFKTLYPQANHSIITAFHTNLEVVSKTGKGIYCMYHGNLSIAENEKAALFLIQHVFPSLKIKLILAGKDPSQLLLNSRNEYIEIIANPSDHELNQLIQNAHIHMLPAFQNTGQKLKLVNALFQGRFVIANEMMIEGSNLASAVIQANTKEEMIGAIHEAMKQDFTDELKSERVLILKALDNIKNAQKIIDLIS